MKSRHTLLCLSVAFVLFAVPAASALAQAPAAASALKGTVERVKVHGKALEGNLEGDSPDRDVFIYLPPGYGANPSQRYPVVYMLHGYGLTAERWMSFTRMADAADKNIEAGIMKPMILVNPDAFTKYNGSMYSSSPTIGDWETYIAEDLVSYVDSHYQTIPDRMSRGLGGHSMGGYGTVRIGMKRPDVFSSMYIMSACCLMNNPGGGNRGAGARGDATPPAPAQQSAAPTPAQQPATPAPTVNATEAGAAQPVQGRGGRGGRGRGNTQGAQAAAWSSNPNNPPDFYDLPTKDGQPVPAVVAKYLANSPLAMVDQYLTSLRKYRAIMLEVGTQDSLAGSNRQLDQSFKTFGISHTFEEYEGDHTNRVPARIEQKVLPFFSNNLSFTAPAK